MGTKVRLEKYINFSLISNCIIFNTLAGCNGKDKKGGKGCCGSGRDKEKTITDQSQQSAEELAKKQKEEEERKQKDKEEADRLAKESQIKLLEASIARREKLLANENYVNKAPSNIVEKERNDLENEKKKLKELTSKKD